MKGQPFNLDACLFKARLCIQDGRTDEGIEELRRGIFEAAKCTPNEGKESVQKILSFAQENEVFDEVETTLENDPLRKYFFGDGTEY